LILIAQRLTKSKAFILISFWIFNAKSCRIGNLQAGPAVCSCDTTLVSKEMKKKKKQNWKKHFRQNPQKPLTTLTSQFSHKDNK